MIGAAKQQRNSSCRIARRGGDALSETESAVRELSDEALKDRPRADREPAGEFDGGLVGAGERAGEAAVDGQAYFAQIQIPAGSAGERCRTGPESGEGARRDLGVTVSQLLQALYASRRIRFVTKTIPARTLHVDSLVWESRSCGRRALFVNPQPRWSHQTPLLFGFAVPSATALRSCKARSAIALHRLHNSFAFSQARM